jgi:hypothetical protein
MTHLRDAFTDERLASVFEQWRDDDDGKEE